MNKLDLLKRVTAFSRLTDEQLSLLARSVGSQTFQRDETIFHQGSIGSTLYIIVSGQVRIYTTSEEGQELTIAIFRDGDFFGEMALIAPGPRMATVKAESDVEAVMIHADAFQSFLLEHPAVAVSMMKQLVIRLREVEQRIDAWMA